MVAEASTEVTVQEPATLAPVHRESGLLGVIERVVMNPDLDIERVEAVLKMRADEEDRQRRMAREDQAEEARRAYLAAMSKAQSEIGPILRNRKNVHTKSMYADLASIEAVVSPILTENGFSTTCTPMPCDRAGYIGMQLTIGHVGGHSVAYADEFPIDAAGSQGKTNKTDIQAKGSTQTYARRYLKATALDLAFTDDRDGNAPPCPAISSEQLATLRAEIEAANADEAKFCEWLGIERLSDLASDHFEQALKALAVKRVRAESNTESEAEQ